MADAPRNYLKEAALILTDESMLLTEKEHLKAVAEDAAVARQRVVVMGQILAALLVDSDRPWMLIPKGILDYIKDRRIAVTIEPLESGSLKVRKVDPRRPLTEPEANVPQPTKVM